MSNEQVFYVRKEAASAVGSLATVIPQNIVVDKLVSSLIQKHPNV